MFDFFFRFENFFIHSAATDMFAYNGFRWSTRADHKSLKRQLIVFDRVWFSQGSKSLVHQASLGKVNCSTLRRVWCHSRVSSVPLFSGIVLKQKQHTRNKNPQQSGRSSLHGFNLAEVHSFAQKNIWWNLYILLAGWRVSSTLPSLSLKCYRCPDIDDDLW